MLRCDVSVCTFVRAAVRAFVCQQALTVLPELVIHCRHAAQHHPHVRPAVHGHRQGWQARAARMWTPQNIASRHQIRPLKQTRPAATGTNRDQLTTATAFQR